jgi:hypothetical protein
MHEDIFAALVRRDESVTAHIVKLHNFAGEHRFVSFRSSIETISIAVPSLT